MTTALKRSVAIRGFVDSSLDNRKAARGSVEGSETRLLGRRSETMILVCLEAILTRIAASRSIDDSAQLEA